MNASPASRRALKGLLGTLAAVLVLLALFVAALALLDANHLRGPLIRYLASHTGREFHIDGPLEAHLLSLHPSFVAEHVTVGNPPWSPPGNMAEIDKLTVVFDLPSFSHELVIRRLEMDGAHLHLQRDAVGHANWHWKAPGILPGKGPPLIHDLSVPAAHLQVEDERRHLVFDGILSAGAQSSAGGDGKSNEPDSHDAGSAPDADAAPPLRISGKGRLNGHEATFIVDGDPLATVSHDKPYHFTLDEHSSGSHLTGHGSLTQPLDFRFIDGNLEANGADLKDLYFLVGVHLIDTGPYKLSGKITRRDRITELTDIAATSGESDVHVQLKSQLDDNGRAHIELDMTSQRLRLADLGARAAGRAPEPPAGEKKALLPDTPLKLEGLRKADYAVSFSAQHIDAEKLSFHTVAGKLTIDHGVVTVPHLAGILVPVNPALPAASASAAASAPPAASTSASAAAPSSDAPEQKISAHLKFDAKTDTPTASVDLRATNIRIAQFLHKDPSQPPLDGLLQGHIDLTGRGRSFRDIASKADGAVTVFLPQGTIRASLAELTGLDFRGLGLMLTKNKEDTPIRCGVASFKAHDGTLTAQTLLIDTDPVLITGGGTIQLDSEALDLELKGHPKQLRVLRLSAPFSVQGTFMHPVIGLEKGHRKLELVDPGHAKDADCGALLAAAKTDPE
jgi:AsmA family protein